MTLSRRVPRADLIAEKPLPRGYGVAWVDFADNQTLVCYPIPLNHVASWIRRRWMRLRVSTEAFVWTQRERELARAWERGFQDGERQGYQDGLRDSARALGAQR